VKKHLGSTAAIVLGIIGFVSGIKPPSEMLIAGPIIVLGALAYRSCKKRKLGEVTNSWLRVVLELAAMLAIVIASVLKNDLKDLMISDPVPNLIIPLVVVLAYVFISLKRYPPVVAT
jgi:hypothetical protein